MNIALWIAAGVLAVVFVGAGAMKLFRSRKQLVEMGQAYAEDFSDGAIRAIGALEVLGALGLILPAVTGIAPILVPLAAVGLALVQLGAATVHARRGERQQVAVNLLLVVLASFVVWGRLGEWAF